MPFVWKSPSHRHQLLRCLWHKKKTFRCSIRDESRRPHKSYFLYGFDYQTICMFLETFHGITISLRTLKWRLAGHRLNKIGSDISDASLQVIIEREVNGPSSLKGYRNIWNKRRLTYGINIPRDKVIEILRNIDSVNSALRIARKLSTVIRFDEVCL